MPHENGIGQEWSMERIEASVFQCNFLVLTAVSAASALISITVYLLLG